MKKTYMKATSFRATMGVIVVLIIGGSAAGFYNAQVWLTNYADEVGKIIPKTDSISSQTQMTNKLKNDITKYQPVADKANTMIATDQDQISQKLNEYATRNGLRITDTRFRRPNDTEAASARLVNAKLNFATITIDTPAKYTNVLKLLKAIEGSIPKMQVTEVIVSRITNSSTNVLVSPITIEFYTR